MRPGDGSWAGVVPLVAGLLGVAAALRMRRIPDPEVREDAPPALG